MYISAYYTTKPSENDRRDPIVLLSRGLERIAHLLSCTFPHGAGSDGIATLSIAVSSPTKSAKTDTAVIKERKDGCELKVTLRRTLPSESPKLYDQTGLNFIVSSFADALNVAESAFCEGKRFDVEPYRRTLADLEPLVRSWEGKSSYDAKLLYEKRLIEIAKRNKEAAAGEPLPRFKGEPLSTILQGVRFVSEFPRGQVIFPYGPLVTNLLTEYLQSVVIAVPGYTEIFLTAAGSRADIFFPRTTDWSRIVPLVVDTEALANFSPEEKLEWFVESTSDALRSLVEWDGLPPEAVESLIELLAGTDFDSEALRWAESYLGHDDVERSTGEILSLLENQKIARTWRTYPLGMRQFRTKRAT